MYELTRKFSSLKEALVHFCKRARGKMIGETCLVKSDESARKFLAELARGVTSGSIPVSPGDTVSLMIEKGDEIVGSSSLIRITAIDRERVRVTADRREWIRLNPIRKLFREDGKGLFTSAFSEYNIDVKAERTGYAVGERETTWHNLPDHVLELLDDASKAIGNASVKASELSFSFVKKAFEKASGWGHLEEIARTMEE